MLANGQTTQDPPSRLFVELTLRSSGGARTAPPAKAAGSTAIAPEPDGSAEPFSLPDFPTDAPPAYFGRNPTGRGVPLSRPVPRPDLPTRVQAPAGPTPLGPLPSAATQPQTIARDIPSGKPAAELGTAVQGQIAR